ncbi:MAG: SdrD B-like domain-containing protein [Acidobacteriota bacterium]
MFQRPLGSTSARFISVQKAIVFGAVFAFLLVLSNARLSAQPGQLKFSFANYTVNENVPSNLATIQVLRIDGNTGAVSVQYATSNGTATAGLDYSATSGTLNWANGDLAPKNIYIPIVADIVPESHETVNIALSNPTGGATLGTPSTAVLTLIQPITPGDVLVDGVRDDEYTAEFAKYKLFNYGPNPNMASGSLYAFASGEYLYVYYSQNPLPLNDNTYGPKQGASWERNWHESWHQGSGHQFADLIGSDKTEFIFYDKSGNVKLNFFADYTSKSGNEYHSLGFWGGDGSMLINNIDCGGCADKNQWLRDHGMQVESSLAWNVGSHTRYYQDCAGHTLDTLASSPPLSYSENGRPYYGYKTQTCPQLEDFADWIYDYAIELRVPLAAFPNEPVIEVVARAHNSPPKNNDEDNPSDPAQASIGDYVWFDWDNDGQQDWFEQGIPNVVVKLYWDKDSDGRFFDNELIVTTRTDGSGYYLFKGLWGGSYTVTGISGFTAYSGAYMVDVDESTLPYGMTAANLTTKRVPYPNEPNEPHILSANYAGPGHADRTFLGVTEDYREADFGYRPTGAVIGDYVWSDSDNDGIQDSGEAGIAGVAVALDRYVNGQWVTNFKTTVTDPTGHYLFFGDDTEIPDGDYRVNVDQNDTELAGYTLTTGPESKTDPTATIHVVRDSNGFFFDIFEDFGYYNPNLGRVGDTVFFDYDWDGFQDSGEPGLANVTLSLYRDMNGNGLKDVADQFMGSTVTNVNGNYWFSGLPVSAAGETYFAVVTDTNGVLTSFQAFYPGGYLSGTITTTARENLTLDFPYVSLGVIGDWVWNDTIRNNVQDAGEPGIAGVTLRLDYYNPDTSSWWNGYRTTTTDSTGHYYFDGLRTTQPNGAASQYRVTVTSVPAGYSAVLVGQGGDTTRDSNNPAGGVTYTLGGSGVPISQHSNLTIDFGYYIPGATYGSVGDYIWEDEDWDGIQDEGEAGVAGVTLELRNASGQPLATTMTDASGIYHFYQLMHSATGIPYQVVITDINHVLDGYTMTTDPSALSVAVKTSPPADLNITTADAGFAKRPTRVTLSGFQAYVQNGSVVVQWQTSSEFRTVGFHLLRADPAGGDPIPVTSQMVPALVTSPAGGTYRVTDPHAFPNQTYAYLLREVERNGKVWEYGPYIVTVGQAAGGLPPQTFDRTPRPIDKGAKDRADEHKALREEHLKKALKGVSAKIPVSQTGLYFLPAARISEGLGISSSAVASGIARKQFTLTNRGREVPYQPAAGNAGLLFYGQAVESSWTRDNMYWLAAGSGQTMTLLSGKGKSGTPPASFMEKLRVEQDWFADTASATDPEADYWFWDLLLAGFEGFDTRAFDFELPGMAASNGRISLDVNVLGVTFTDAPLEHHVVISVNGSAIGDAQQWDGARPKTMHVEFDSGLLHPGVNTVELKSILNPGVDFEMLLVDSFDFTYSRLYSATENRLLFPVSSSGPVSVGGFTSNSITVLEISDPLDPRLVTDCRVEAFGGGYRVSFVAPAGGKYLAVAADAVPQATARADAASDLKNLKGADYIVLAAGELAQAAQTLADYRSGQGLQSLVVDVEDVMDEFNFGNSSPYAIRDFLKNAVGKWKKAPKFVVLVGTASYDYKDILGLGANMVPTLMIPTLNGLFPSDTSLADVDGDSRPDLAIGRLPVMTVAELNAAAAKIAEYEQAAAAPWMKRLVLAADAPDPDAGDFPSESDGLAALVSADITAGRIYLSSMPFAQARQALIGQINQGVSMLNWVGHGSYQSLSFWDLLTNGDVPGLTNGNKLPVLTAFTCLAGSFATTGWDSLAQTLVVSPGGGAIAAFTPTGMNENDHSMIVARQFFATRFDGQTRRLGEVAVEALRRAVQQGAPTETVYQYGIIGDPALIWR